MCTQTQANNNDDNNNRKKEKKRKRKIQATAINHTNNYAYEQITPTESSPNQHHPY